MSIVQIYFGDIWDICQKSYLVQGRGVNREISFSKPKNEIFTTLAEEPHVVFYFNQIFIFSVLFGSRKVTTVWIREKVTAVCIRDLDFGKRSEMIMLGSLLNTLKMRCIFLRQLGQ